jgi:two-component system, LuxR family, sensor kinase FixL
MDELMASVAHEINQPLPAVVTNGNACQRWLVGAEPNLEEARSAVARMTSEGNRARNLIKEIRAFVKEIPAAEKARDHQRSIRDTLMMVTNELAKNQIALQTKRGSDLPALTADRVQLQQVLLNLMMNAIEAMSGIKDRSRELSVTSEPPQDNHGRVRRGAG